MKIVCDKFIVIESFFFLSNNRTGAEESNERTNLMIVYVYREIEEDEEYF
jgi:hypothetical protein